MTPDDIISNIFAANEIVEANIEEAVDTVYTSLEEVMPEDIIKVISGLKPEELDKHIILSVCTCTRALRKNPVRLDFIERSKVVLEERGQLMEGTFTGL
jgi:hypothetical protein